MISVKNKLVTKEAHNAIAEKYYELYKDDISDLKYFDLFLEGCKSKILDLGCGMGHYSNYMYNKGFDVVGIDFSQNMINKKKVSCNYFILRFFDSLVFFIDVIDWLYFEKTFLFFLIFLSVIFFSDCLFVFL